VVVTVHRACGFRFVMFTNDHSPPHVHVFEQGGEAKIELSTGAAPVAVWVNGISHADMRRIMGEVRERHLWLIEAWRRIHG
jgi:hypothetical protein